MAAAKEGTGLRTRITSHDVARAAGVSQSAVSRALARAPGVSEPTRQRILKVAEGLGYQPNALASGLITQRSGMVGIVLSQLANPFLSEATECLLTTLRKEGLQVLVAAADSDAEIGEATTAFGRYRVDGCLVISPHLPRSVATMYDRLGPTVILFNRRVPGMSASAVSVDNVAGGALAAEHLIGRGHERLAYLHGTPGATADRDRFAGFSRRLAKAGLPPAIEGFGDFSYDGAAAACLAMLRRPAPPTAIFCADDIMAMAVIDTARHGLGLRIPGDLAVLGFDDAAPAAWPGYELSTLRQPMPAMVRAGIDLLLDGGTGDSTVRHIAFDTELVVRGTT